MLTFFLRPFSLTAILRKSVNLSTIATTGLCFKSIQSIVGNVLTVFYGTKRFTPTLLVITPARKHKVAFI